MVDLHLGVLRRYALVLTRDADQAEDLVQESLVRAIAGAAGWQAGRELRPWLLSIVHNTHVTRRRRAQVEAAGARVLATGAPSVVPATQLQRVELSQTMQTLLTLPEDQRNVMVLRIVADLTVEQTAAVLDKRAGAVKARLLTTKRRAQEAPALWRRR